MLYDDGLVTLDEEGVTLRRYYLWGAAKHIPYATIASVRRRSMSAVTGRWRIWGSGDLVHYWPLDTKRPGKSEAIEVDTGHHWIPTFTPDDPERVARILDEHTVGKDPGRR